MRLQVRPVRRDDVEDIYRIVMQDEVMPSITSLPSGRYDALVARYESLTPNHHEFVAELDSQVVGHAGLTQLSGRRSHVASFFIAVDVAFHRQGIATALLTKILDLADNWLMLDRVELGVLEDNVAAKSLYEKHGFVTEGKKIGAIRSAGQYANELVMSRLRPSGLLRR